MQTVRLPDIGTAEAWRDAARTCLLDGLPPEDVLWHCGSGSNDLFGEDRQIAVTTGAFSVPKSFVALADSVVWHRDPERFARLYALLWRIKDRPQMMADRGDPALSLLRAMEKAVYRCQHKMKAFVRFREIDAPDTGRRRFAAWFEPSHFTLEPTAPFFARRFGDMDWCIVTPNKTATFENCELRFAEGQARPALPDDGAEELWSTYFCNIFNPARLKVKAMQAEMPKKYWQNLPEARAIPALIATAETRARSMQAAAPSLPPLRAQKLAERVHNATKQSEEQRLATDLLSEKYESLEALHRGAANCTRCPLYRDATQVVMGEGPSDAPLMFVGEQPGDQEDLAGRPFVGPAGQLFDEVCQAAGIDRDLTFVTNAVKHFKFTPRGKRRIHQRPNAGEIAHCRWWLDLERELVQPKLIVAMGATAAEALTGSGKGILKRRSQIEEGPDGTPVLLTVHPSYLLRLPDPALKAAETDRFREDLERAREYLD